jgi:SBP domain
LKSEWFSVHGVPSRFCQRCGLSHALTEFDGKRKSCRVALEKHNNRRKARVEGAAAANVPQKNGNGGAANGSSNGGNGGAQKFSGFPGVADLSGWDPNLARELEALLSDDPIIELPPNFIATAASGALGGVASVAIGANNINIQQRLMTAPGSNSEALLEYSASGPTPLSITPNAHMQLQRINTGDGHGGGANNDMNIHGATTEQPELGCDGQPLSPTLLRLARIDTNARGGNELEYQQFLASSPFAMDLPSLNTLTQQQQQLQQQVIGTNESTSGAIPFSFPLNPMAASTLTPTLEPASSAPQQFQLPQQQQQQQPIQFIVVAPGMSLPNGIQMITHPAAAAAANINGGTVGVHGLPAGMHMAMQMTPRMLPPQTMAAGQVQQHGSNNLSNSGNGGGGTAAVVPGPPMMPPLQPGQQMQWVLMPSNMVPSNMVMMQQQHPSPTHQQQPQQQQGESSSRPG